MVAVVEMHWQDILDGKPFPENSARAAWREAVVTVAEKAKAALPAANGRIDAAVKMVLAGDVELQPDGTAKVASQSNGQMVYHVVNGECSCKDYPKAPQSMCKHRIAYGIHKRAKTLATQHLEQRDGTGNGQHAAEAPQAAASATPLPEAPASANVYVMLAGRKVQMTLRDGTKHGCWDGSRHCSSASPVWRSTANKHLQKAGVPSMACR